MSYTDFARKRASGVVMRASLQACASQNAAAAAASTAATMGRVNAAAAQFGGRVGCGGGSSSADPLARACDHSAVTPKHNHQQAFPPAALQLLEKMSAQLSTLALKVDAIEQDHARASVAPGPSQAASGGSVPPDAPVAPSASEVASV